MISVFDGNSKVLMKLYTLICIMFLTFASPIMMQPAFAAAPDPAAGGGTGAGASMITNVLCNAVNQLTGPIGKSIAILIMISLAIMLFLGKITWGIGIAFMVGMGLLFGAKGAVDLLATTGPITGGGVCGA